MSFDDLCCADDSISGLEFAKNFGAGIHQIFKTSYKSKKLFGSVRFSQKRFNSGKISFLLKILCSVFLLYVHFMLLQEAELSKQNAII
jgi:hypothetical protein